jgi:hydrogenase/urease accessory protein HupE
MRRLTIPGTVLTLVAIAVASPAQAHPVPFSYLDLRVQSRALDVTLVVHIFDVAHDLGIDPPEQLLDAERLAVRGAAFAALLPDRLQLRADGRRLSLGAWSAAEPLAERQSIRLHALIELDRSPGIIGVTTRMFPYDPVHQTFVNFYEGDQLTSQAIIDGGRDAFDYYAATTPGVLAILARFVPDGVRHILGGPDHLLFLIGLLLLGGTMRQLLWLVSAFTLAHSLSLSASALNVFSPSARFVEPAIALAIIYVGADNLMVRGGPDVRVWIAAAFGFIHGFGFANVLKEMNLPRQALVWSLVSFNIGVEVGQVIVVLAVATALATLRSRSESAGRRVAFAGSLVVIAAGTFWFIQRVFFPGGMA